MAAIVQLRALGGVIGLSIASSVLNNHVRSGLADNFPPQASELLLQSAAAITTLPESLQVVARNVYADGYSLQMKTMIGFAAAQAVGLGIMWERTPRRIA